MGHLLPQHHYISVKRGERGYNHNGDLQQSIPFDSNYRDTHGIVYNVGSPSTVFGNGPRFTLQEAIKWYYKCVGIRLEIATDTFANYDFPITNKTTKAHKYCESMLLKDDNITSLSFADALTDGTMNYWAFSPSFDFVTQTDDDDEDRYAFVRYEHGETDLGQFSGASGAAFTGDPIISIARKFFTRSELGAATSASLTLLVYDTVNVPPDEPETRVFTLDLSSDKVAISSTLTLDSSVSSFTQTAFTVPSFSLGPAGSFNFTGDYANASAFAAVINDFNDTYEDVYEITEYSASTYDNSITRRTRTFEGVNYYQLYNPTYLNIVHKLND